MVSTPAPVPVTNNGDMFSHNLTRYQTVMTKKSYFSLIKELLGTSVISFDLETQSDAKGKKGNMEDWHPHSRIVSASFTTPSDTWFVPLSHPEGLWSDKWKTVYRNLVKAMLQSQAKLVAHNAKYEVRWTYTMTGYALEDRIWWDTMMSAYLLDENESASLKEVAVRDLGVERWDDVDLRDSESVPLSSLGLYNARDTDYTLRLVPIHKQRLLDEARLARLFHFEGMPIIRTLAKIERTGLPLDVEKVKTMQVESKRIVKEKGDELLKYAVDELKMELEDYATVSFGTTNKFFTSFMEKTGFPVISLTDTGNPSWTADNLETLVDMGFPIAQDIMDVRKHSSRQSKFFTPWLRSVSEEGRLHPSFNPMLVDDKWDKAKGTKTGRLSSSGQLNAQQIARDLKHCFGGEDDWLMVELDYSQIELRIAAWIAQVQPVLEAYERGDDLHTLMAAAITGKDPSDIVKDERQSGKAGNFGFLYDMGETTYIEYARTNYKVVVSLEEARKTRHAFFDVQWQGLAKWHDRQRKLVRRDGFVRNPLGRKRRLPEAHSGAGYLIGQAERRAINSPIQSFAADLMCLALIRISREMDPSRVRLVGTVHDSLLAQVRNDSELWDNVERMARLMLDPGTHKMFGVRVDVPLVVDANVGYHWNDPDGEARTFGSNDSLN